jgi:predicted nuclease with RNAse H fold
VKQYNNIVAGIDVGGSSKGFHAVAFRDGQYLSRYRSHDPKSIAEWCRETDALLVGIDAPCRWRSSGKARAAERELAREKISCFVTPDKEKAHIRPFYQWMLNGAELYSEIEPDYPLFSGRWSSGPVCFETFPQAVACALAGSIVSAKQKAVVRRDLLSRHGIDLSALTNIDFVDGALCALTAHYLLMGKVRAYGDNESGYIVVPALELI